VFAYADETPKPNLFFNRPVKMIKHLFYPPDKQACSRFPYKSTRRSFGRGSDAAVGLVNSFLIVERERNEFMI
jgi:hypothetical protein